MRIIIIALIGLVFFSNTANAHTCSTEKVKCPIDGKTVEFCVTMSMTTFGSFYDFQKKGAIGNHYEELINSCPKCHFSGYLSDFKKNYTKDERNKIKNFLIKYKEWEINDVTECQIAAEIKGFKNQKNDDIANCYLIGSYLIRTDTTKIILREKFQIKTEKYLILAIKNNEYEDISVIATINYLIAEMNRRTRNFDKAILHYEKAINDPNKKDWVEKVATKQKKIALKKDDDNSI